MLSKSLGIMRIHFVLFFFPSPYCHEHLMIPSSHILGGLHCDCLRSLGYHSRTALVQLLFINFATCPAQRNIYFPYSVIISFIQLRSRITSFQTCSM